MTDIHTHILPGMDDGARDAEQSLAMLRMEARQGVRAVVLTPHFYPKREAVESFLSRRAAAYQRLTQAIGQLPEADRTTLPALYLGAEVAWQSDLLDCPDLTDLCLGGGKYMLVELPFTPWNSDLIRQMYELMACFGITPVIAHLERYLDDQNSEMVEKLLKLDIPIQISCDVLEHFFRRRKAMKLLRRRRAHLIASDCHDCTDRPPRMEQAAAELRRKLGREHTEELLDLANTLLG